MLGRVMGEDFSLIPSDKDKESCTYNIFDPSIFLSTEASLVFVQQTSLWNAGSLESSWPELRA